MKDKSIYGLKPSQLGRLLSVSAQIPESASDMSEDQTRAALFRDHLGKRLADEPDLLELLGCVGGQITNLTPPVLDRSLQELLLDPQSSLPILQAIKDHGKRLSAAVSSGAQTLVMTTLYYAAIAAAIVHHDQRITKYSRENLAERFSLLAQRTWIDEEIRGLFVQAAERCQEREKGGGGQ